MTRPSQLPAFDPRSVPIIGVDTHLPAIPLNRLTPTALRRRFAAPPQWQPEVRCEPSFVDRAPAPAAVLLPLVERPSGVAVLLTERTADLPTHSGQVAFPGGKAEAQDASVVETALRETQEEVGLERRFIDVLGELPIYVTGSQFIVTPVVALVQEGFVLHPNTAEVAKAFEVPLVFLMNPAHHRRHRFEWNGTVREWYSMSFLEPAPVAADTETGQSGCEHYIWGATAGMLRNFYRFLLA